jgi:Carbohydrate-selective porin, OprB family
VTPLIGAARPRFQNVVSPPPPIRGVAANLSSMLNLPSEIETLSPNFWETFRDRSVVVPPRSGSANAVLTGTIEPSPCMLALWQDPDNPSRGWGLFGQFEASDGNPNPVSAMVFVGLGGSTPGRLDDRWGVAWFDYMFSSHLKTGLAAIGQGLRDERGLEAYYDMAIADHIRFGPDAQVIWPGTPGKTTAVFLGARHDSYSDRNRPTVCSSESVPGPCSEVANEPVHVRFEAAQAAATTQAANAVTTAAAAPSGVSQLAPLDPVLTPSALRSQF